MERYIECGLVGLVYACSCLSMFIIISFLGQMVKCVEFLCYLLSAESGAQMYYLSSLFGRHLFNTTVDSTCYEFYITGLKMTILGRNMLPE